MQNAKGFTIVEIIITLAVIGILVTIGFLSYNQVQSESRDTQRSSRIGAITEALEKYFAKNGEYPGCSAMTQSASTVVANTLQGLDPQALTAPKSTSGGNSITCTALNPGGADAYAYVGDGSTICNTGNSCIQYTLQYFDESTNTIKSVDSRHRSQAVTSGASSLAATSGGTTQINLTWSAVSGATSYQLQRATDNNFTANLVTSTPSGTSTAATGLTPGATYYFRIAGVTTTGQGDWSNTASASTSINAPTGTPTASANLVGTDAVATSSVVACSSGTVQYQFQHRSTATAATGAWSSWSTWAATTSYSVAALQGYQYGFQVQARCMGPNIGSSATPTSNIPTVVRPIATPAAPTYLSPSSFDSPNHAIVNFAGSCPSGTNTINATFRSRAWTGSNYGPNPWGFDDWWTNNTGSNRNVEYWGKYQCQTTHSTSAVSPESYNVIVVTP